jgi:hypothetical protein
LRRFGRLARLAAACVCALAAAGAPGQNQVATQDLWALDFQTAMIHTFGAGTQTLGPPIVLAGTGSTRGIGFNQAGLAYVARGQDVRTYDGVTTAVFADVTDGIDQAQHVAVRPGAAQEVWVAAGTSVTNSKIIKFSSAGAVLQTFTNAMMVHPRRITWNLDGTKLYVASNSNKKILTVDAMTGAFTQLADLTANNILPIGVAFDATRNAVWTVGDFGANGDIGFVDAMTGAYTSVLTEGQYPGLEAPTNVFFDRFRTLSVAARNLNLGIGGVYRFYAPTGSVVSDLGPITAGLTSIIDVAFRPEIIGIGAPTSGGNFVLNASMSLGVSNAITFSAPRAAGQGYAAALSPRWQTACDPFVPGILEPSLRLPFPEARGVPLSLSDGGFLVAQTAAVCCFPATPAPINGILLISGFSGFLDASGNANAFVDFFAAPPPVINGVDLSLAFITVDPSSPSGFGRISNPICLTVVLGP